MRKITYVEFEAGDPEPPIPYVLDNNGDKWNRDGDTWHWSNLERTWEELFEYASLRAPEELFEKARAEVERQIAELEEKAAKLRAALGPVSTKAPRVWTDGTLPAEEGLKVRDRQGDVWRQGMDGKVIGGHWFIPDLYAPYTEVLDTP